MPPSGHTESTVAPERKLTPRTVVAAVLGGLVVLFAVVNTQTVTIHWIVTTTDTPLIVVIAGCGLIGFAVGWLIARRAARRQPR